MIWTATFWKATGERAIATAAQVALVAWGAGTLPDTSLPWWTIPAMAAAGGALSILKALAASQVGHSGPSFTDAERLS